MSLAAKLKDLRIRKGESLQKVADAVGVSKAHIWELERGSSKNPGLELLKKLGEHFSVSVDYFLDDEKSPGDAAALQFFREFEGTLTSKDWDMLRTFAERLKDDSK